jgi:hypothetical protein
VNGKRWEIGGSTCSRFVLPFVQTGMLLLKGVEVQEVQEAYFNDPPPSLPSSLFPSTAITSPVRVSDVEIHMRRYNTRPVHYRKRAALIGEDSVVPTSTSFKRSPSKTCGILWRGARFYFFRVSSTSTNAIQSHVLNTA